MTTTSTPLRTPTRVRTWFRIAAIAEAFSWAGLLVGMYLKYVPETTELGVKIFGPVHGALFITYLLVTLLARTTFGWSLRLTAVGLIAAVPPFFTLIFEWYVERRGMLKKPHPRALADVGSA